MQSQLDFHPSNMCSFRTFGLPALRPLFDMCYSDNGKRKITREWLGAIDTPLALASWFMDSGSPMKVGKTYQIRITVPRARYNEVELVQEVLLWELCGINATHYLRVPTTSSEIPALKGRHTVHILKREDNQLFVDLVAPFVEEVPSMRWKIEPFL